MQTALMIIHVIVSLALIVVVLMQHGKQQGLSGAIAGGAETFFGKNKGRTVDAMLRKVTAVIAALFIVLSVVLAVLSINSIKPADNAGASDSQGQQITIDENGNLVDESGNFVLDDNGNPVNINQAEDSEGSENDGEADGADGSADTTDGEEPEAQTGADADANTNTDAE